ncbi:MAG: CoA-binding protein [Myxococcota bacterium]|jgi:hypothetical protein|nr:CoA-binding protein [bacterium]MDP6074141.1 CoA-binding protein [Myxococcota bacterium]MDP6241788.1 CoA-binding protein [Myxococcota bacterium]MDP7074576.1 CoA-binding protein [Myxococcota bacterium]MDP7299452.1 CoA-binding protein [Myxococcota bacterium]
MDDTSLRELLLSAHSLAVVGIKDRETEDAFQVPAYLQAAGYRILPINPKLERVLGEPAFGSLGELPCPADLANLFRASHHVSDHVDELLALDWRPRTVWMQRGISHPESARRLEAEGVAVVEDRCLLVEHRRLVRDA